jgi:hypothetical protein
MADLSDEERQALNVLAGHSDGCDEAVLLTDGFTVRQLARMSQCAPTARFTSGGRIHPGNCR